MSISSIDTSTVLPRTIEAAEIQGKELSQFRHTGESIASQFQEKVQQQTRQTVEPQKSETKDFDMKGSSKNKGRQSERKRKKKDETEAEKSPQSGSSFDIKI